MGTIRVVWGSGTGPTATSAYDAALAGANLHNYNLVTLSSVIPAATPLEVVGTAPDLGPDGNRLSVVQGRATVGPDEVGPAVAALGWSREESGRGIFYEAGGDDPGDVRTTVEDGLRRGRDLREWTFVEGDTVVREAPGDPEAYATVVVCAVYGQSIPSVPDSGSF